MKLQPIKQVNQAREIKKEVEKVLGIDLFFTPEQNENLYKSYLDNDLVFFKGSALRNDLYLLNDYQI